MHARLVRYDSKGDIEAEHVLQDKSTTIGREVGNMVQLTEQDVSKQHAVIQEKLLSWIVCDIESSNGVFINGRRVKKRAKIKNGDEVCFGPVPFTFELAASMSGWGQGLTIDASPRAFEVTIIRKKDEKAGADG